MTKNKYVGIDPSLTNTGICILSDTGSIEKITDFKSECKKKKFVNIAERLKIISDFVISNTIFLDHNVHICYENYSYDSVNKAFTIGELGGVLKFLIIPKAKSFTLVPPSVLKKFATGTGSADKKMILEFLKRETGLQLKSDDMGDAYFLAKMAQFISGDSKHFGPTLLRHRLTEIKKGKFETITN